MSAGGSASPKHLVELAAALLSFCLLASVLLAARASAEPPDEPVLHYADDWSMYVEINDSPYEQAKFFRNVGRSIFIGDFHVTAYDSSSLTSDGKLSLINDSSMQGSKALISCVLSGEEAMAVAYRIRKGPYEGWMIRPEGFAEGPMWGDVKFADGSRGVIAVIDPCHVSLRRN